MKKGVLKNFAKFTKKYLCWRFFFENFIEKETLAQESFCEFAKFFRTTFLQSTSGDYLLTTSVCFALFPNYYCY